MKVIHAQDLRKEFISHASRAGLAGAFRDLFTRNYKTLVAVNDISLDIEQGEMVGYIGENGAGKSTTIKMLTGILTPTAGIVRVNGMNPHKQREEFAHTIGVVFGQRSQLWWDIAVQESFRLLKKVYKVKDTDYKNHMGYVIETLDIGPLLDKPVRKLSLGQRMRCELAAALIHNPPLLFLDEPTIGLDVLVKSKIRRFLHELNETYKTTVLLTTHDLSDIEALCERVLLLDEGKIIYDGRLEQLQRDSAKGKQVEFQFFAEVDVHEIITETAGCEVKWVQKDPFTWLADIFGADEAVSRLISLTIQKYPIKNVRINETSTEEIVKRIYEEGRICS